MKDLSNEKFLKSIEYCIKEWKDMPSSFIRRILSKCPYFPKCSTDSMKSLSKFQCHFLQK
jgi:putative component of membrane protein insertase Oxa1/YidC/SpoIIIJ protein YidD